MKSDTKTIKLVCNLTGDSTLIYRDFYSKRVEEYGSEELLERFYIKRAIISYIKQGLSMEEIANIVGFTYDENKKDYYNDLMAFHMRAQNAKKKSKDSTTTQMETDPDVVAFIEKWKSSLS